MTQRAVYRTELTSVSFLQRSAYVFPDRPAVVHGRRLYSHLQLEERVNRLAAALRAAGLNKHDRVAFLCPNIPPMLEAHYGVPAAGGVLVAINTRLNSDEIGYILQHSGSRMLFVDAELEGLVTTLDLSAIKVVRVDDTGAAGDPYEDFLATGSPNPVESSLEDEEETLSINYTSGTAGRPKEVMYTRRGAYLNALGEATDSSSGSPRSAMRGTWATRRRTRRRGSGRSGRSRAGPWTPRARSSPRGAERYLGWGVRRR